MHFALASFVAVAAATLAAAQPSTKPSMNPARSAIRPVDWDAAPAPAPAPVTNAKRFELNMPPLKPRTHRRSPHRGGPHTGTRVQGAPRAMTSPLPPVNQKCNIKAMGLDGTDFGFVAPVFNDFGEYGIFQPVQAGALEVSFTYSPYSPSQLDFTTTNGPSAKYPFFGGVVGFASTSNDFAVGSYNYAYLAGSTQIPFGPASFDGDNSFGAATAVPADMETAIWSYDPKTQAITAQWINTGLIAPPTHIVYANDFNEALILTSDPAVFGDTFQGSPYPEITFTCVPPASLPVVPA